MAVAHVLVGEIQERNDEVSIKGGYLYRPTLYMHLDSMWTYICTVNCQEYDCYFSFNLGLSTVWVISQRAAFWAEKTSTDSWSSFHKQPSTFSHRVCGLNQSPQGYGGKRVTTEPLWPLLRYGDKVHQVT